MADLTYNIVEMTLTGTLDGTDFNARAYSGGRAGSKQDKVVHPILANNPFGMSIKTKGNYAGGPLPLGTYTMKTHESRKNWIRLNPVDPSKMLGRDGFAIHGRGPRGSDGCIVPQDFDNVLTLHALLKAREKASRPAPLLEVIATGDIDFIEKRMRDWMRTA
ncbi:MAG TPA: tlde1 domain-containing protein [Allosphingosinicella sp.]|jgi:hypothetical protein